MSGSSMPPAHTQAAAAPAAAAQPVLHISKDTIKDVQSKLKAQGFNPGPEDGIMGPKTRRALASYQSKKGLPRTAELDDVTLRDITGGSMPAGSGSSMPPATGGNPPAKAPSGGGQPGTNTSNPPATQQQ